MKKWLQKSDLLYIAVLVLLLLAAGADVVRARSNAKTTEKPIPATGTETTGTNAPTATTTSAPPAATGPLQVGYYDVVDGYLTNEHKGKAADIVNEIAKALGREVGWVKLTPNQKAEDVHLLADPLTAVRPETGAMLRSKPYDIIDYRVLRKRDAIVVSPAALIDYVRVFYPKIEFAESDPAGSHGRVARLTDPAARVWEGESLNLQVPAAIGVANAELLTAVNATIDRRLKPPPT